MRKKVFILFMITAGFMILGGCGSKQLSINYSMVSTAELHNVSVTNKENRHIEKCTWFVFGFPLNDISTPQVAFTELNENAAYVNNLALYQSGWRLLLVSEDKYLLAKNCWNADGTAALR